MSHRRQFFKQAAGLTAMAALPSLALLSQRQAQAQANNYKALVCVYLYGANDGYNTLIPLDTTGSFSTTGYNTHAVYNSYRPYWNATALTGVGIPIGSTLPLIEGSGNAHYGMHPSLTKLQSHWTSGKLAWVRNVGTLVEPLTRATLNTAQKPTALLSHSDQQEISLLALQSQPAALNGWGARMMQEFGTTITGASTPPAGMITFNGASNPWIASTSLNMWGLKAQGSLDLVHTNPVSDLKNLAIQSGRPMAQAYGNIMSSAYDKGATINAAFANSTVSKAAFSGASSLNSNLHSQLLSVAQFIEARTNIGAPDRQVFIVGLGGFDTHADQYEGHAGLLATLGDALHAFRSSMVTLGLDNNVTTFSMSDFGRALRMNNTNGTDHAWSSHSLVMGGAVTGGIYGHEIDWAANGPAIASFGQENVVIPQVSIDQLGAQLATWFGVPPSSLNTVFPNLANYSGTSPNIAFI